MAMLNEIRETYKQSLKHLYDDGEINEFLRLIANDFLKVSFNDFRAFETKPLANNEIDIYHNLLPQFLNGKPYQYILGYEYFCGLTFKVNNAVLIPRPETEELVHKAVACIKNNNLNTVADFGTGSGCIAIALQHLCSNIIVNAYDISMDALAIANENNALVNNKVNFKQYDILNNLPNYEGFTDLLISNPPYIPEAEKEAMHINVTAHEPNIALFTPNNEANIFYEKLAWLGTKILNKNGFIFFEIHYLGGAAVAQILKKYNYKNIEIIKSIFGQDRFVVAQMVN